MTFIEGLQLITSSGVLAGGLGVLKWALSIERRMMRVELTHGLQHSGER